MKKSFAYAIVAVGLVLAGCQDMPTAFDSDSQYLGYSSIASAHLSGIELHNNGKSVGTLDVTNDLDNLYLSFVLADGLITGVDIHVASTPTGLPQNKQNNPVVGHFDHKYPAVLSDEFGATIPLLPGYVNESDEVVIAIHISAVIDGKEVGIWAGSDRFRGDQKGGNWATYFSYTLEYPEAECELEDLGWMQVDGTTENSKGHFYLTKGVSGFDGTFGVGTYGTLVIDGDEITVTANAGYYVHQVWYQNASGTEVGNYGSYAKAGPYGLETEAVIEDVPVSEDYLYLRVQFAEEVCE